MSPLAAPLVTFLFFSGFAAAQIYAPDCSLTWEWTFNSLDQNACTVAAYLMSTCNGGTFTIDALKAGYSYTGPSGVDDTNLCKCNTVTYSLISACDACQGAVWTSWSDYSSNCTKTLPPSSFPNPVPLGTRVPQWALLDITSENNWNSNKSFAVGDSPEQAAGVILGPSGATVSSSASGTRSGATSSLSGESSSTAKPTSSPTSKSSSNMGIIVGGAVGGVVVIALAAIAIGFFLRQRRSEAPASVAPPFVGASQPHMDEIQQPLTMDDGYTSSIPGTIGSSMPGTPLSPMRIYNPNDPSTFPGYQGPEYQGVPQTPATPPQGPVPSANGTGNSLATMQTAQGYHGLPTV
ncbi:hypothetical protein V8E52_004544 [Russula decolorans]